jgi:outer membrane protein TolC
VKLVLLGLLALPLGAFAASPYEISLESTEAAALSASATLKAQGLELQASRAQDGEALTYLLPRLSLDAGDQYNTHVASLPFGPGGKALPFGDYNNYSYGVDLNWSIWDSGNAYNLYKALQASEAGKSAEYEAGKRNLRLKARMAYFQTQLMAERARLLADSLSLSQSEAQDISVRLKEGASSRIDSLSANNEVLQRRGEYRQARADLASALRDLFALTGLGSDLDPSVPQVASSSENPPADTEPATLTLKLQSLEASLAELQGAETAQFSPSQPQLAALKFSAEAARKQADALESGYWPKINVGFRASRAYPDGPILTRYQQNQTAVSATWEIFSFGRTKKEVEAQEDIAGAVEERAQALATDLQRDWEKSHDRLKALKDQKELDEQSVTETENLYKLIYNSYQNGSSSLLEVQSASLRALEAKVNLASTQTQMLIELAVESSLSE